MSLAFDSLIDELVHSLPIDENDQLSEPVNLANEVAEERSDSWFKSMMPTRTLLEIQLGYIIPQETSPAEMYTLHQEHISTQMAVSRLAIDAYDQND